MIIKKIPEAELLIMKVIWCNEKIISSKEIIKIMEDRKQWKKTTTLTLLKRLTDKKIISAEKGKRITYYTAIVSEKNYSKMETSNFFKKFHGNSLKSFITTLHDNNDINDKDLDELEAWIRDSR
ncbi:BlaI/MecI/CopY family transcriptional regulator [Clostridium estertheticum]|uniref:BlaI/MecI/CopY family transcriptional regulator n=1 Tax=Clostridium estertheticum TaxID=238834 RepID=A0A5N7IJU6_9CLOT|nr:BlaI/MecI/CopY family transcriptional regulator [Clostridium estertheticum]MBU3184898.1 BlaI/MecI/CopY family transcriptional regulator [Clostridium estertheticum]MCB2357310.1 BlaI/MecI/CopY family transcriptional regulator [Clostridium estertheticum]MPQ30574.1 BlaI/MecI/CopY family transcriptional regulator [Clostridium estertheticum]MPQ61250.1 BlaI/MecI/CopY family transcriptional regulator [Clostridium estertheticum]WAG40354.1 BlaI/MecI/CopY family transcriptional regulator [Clostridium 